MSMETEGQRLGYRTPDEAKKNQVSNERVSWSQEQRKSQWAKKEPVFKKFEAMHPEHFWRDWTVDCPAWRADRMDEDSFYKQKCGAMAVILTQKNEPSPKSFIQAEQVSPYAALFEEKKRKKPLTIFCPECLYEGEWFKTFYS